MRTLLLALGFAACAAAAGNPFFLFDAVNDPTVLPVLQKYFRNTDYLGARVVAAFPALSNIVVTREHRVDLEPSLAQVERSVGAGCNAAAAGTVFYVSDAPPTPPSEQAQPIASIASAAASIRAAGCGQVGIAPGPSLYGYQPGSCGYDLSTSPFRQVDWTTIDVLDIQGEYLLGEKCVGPGSVNSYVQLVTAVAEFVRGKNPRIVVMAQLSFRFTPPSLMVPAAQALGAVVDGFLLSYPLNPALEHKYCSAANLDAVLGALRTGIAAP